MGKTKIYWGQFLVILIVAACMAGCKKERVAATRLDNTSWHSTTETVYFPNGTVDTHSMYYDTWEFMSDRKIKWTNSFGIIAHVYTGDWHLVKDNNLVISVSEFNSSFTKSYTVISFTDSLLKVSTEDVVIESGANGRSSKVEYEFKRF